MVLRNRSNTNGRTKVKESVMQAFDICNSMEKRYICNAHEVLLGRREMSVHEFVRAFMLYDVE